MASSTILSGRGKRGFASDNLKVNRFHVRQFEGQPRFAALASTRLLPFRTLVVTNIAWRGGIKADALPVRPTATKHYTNLSSGRAEARGPGSRAPVRIDQPFVSRSASRVNGWRPLRTMARIVGVCPRSHGGRERSDRLVVKAIIACGELVESWRHDFGS